MKFGLLPQPVGLLKLMLNLFHVMNVQGRELYLRGFVKYIFNSGFHLDAYELISFKLDLMIDTTGLNIWYQLEWPWPALRVRRMLELIQLQSSLKWPEHFEWLII